MSYKTLNFRVDDRGVGYLELNRPEKRNAFSADLIADLTAWTGAAAQDPALRVVVLSGAGKVFCAGGDLDWMMDQIRADRETRMAEARHFARLLRAINELPVPLIARIHGGAFGGGVGLACTVDYAIAQEGTRFGLTETRLGLIPATISPYVIGRLGEGMARRVFMSARLFEAEEARALGLVAEVHPADAMDDAVEAQVAPYLSVSTAAVGRAKALARSLGPRIDDAVIEETVTRLADTWESPEAAQGIQAFLNKTPPPWA